MPDELMVGGAPVDDEEMKTKRQELVAQIQEKSVQLSDLEIILEDYERERRGLLREIGQLKALLWELIGDADVPSSLRSRNASALDEVND
jgi:hypothetical protein